ncbi:MAG: hypothetical protein IPH27_04670 [Actinomycetales bacterium]|nr:hypothetical protein [Candidatus Phosphoribacter baldrii]MBK6954798.1 hypothetical protein [Candidatus Phosphoribacter baldrii]
MPPQPSQPPQPHDPNSPPSRRHPAIHVATSATQRLSDIARSVRARSQPAPQGRVSQVVGLARTAVTAATEGARALPARVGSLPRPAHLPRPGLATVHGRSMEPTLHEGDRLIVLWGGPVIPGRLALVRLPDSPGGPRPLSVKRVSGPEADRPGHWWIERDNPREGVDSWQVGGIPASDVAALVVARIPALPALRGSLRRLTRGRLG